MAQLAHTALQLCPTDAEGLKPPTIRPFYSLILPFLHPAHLVLRPGPSWPLSAQSLHFPASCSPLPSLLSLPPVSLARASFPPHPPPPSTLSCASCPQPSLIPSLPWLGGCWGEKGEEPPGGSALLSTLGAELPPQGPGQGLSLCSQGDRHVTHPGLIEEGKGQWASSQPSLELGQTLSEPVSPDGSEGGHQSPI